MAYFLSVQIGPNADVRKWQDEQIGIATVTFGSKDAKEKSMVYLSLVGYFYSACL